MSSIEKQAAQKPGLLAVEESQWKQMADAVARVMWPAAEES